MLHPVLHSSFTLCFSSFIPPVGTFERALPWSLLLPSCTPVWDTSPQPARHLLDLKLVSSLPICLAITALTSDLYSTSGS